MSLENPPKFLLNFSESEMKDEQRHSYRFKAFRLEVEERQLFHHDQPVPLTPKAFDVLVALVERSGHLVEKDELMRIVWSDSFVEEANLPRLVHTIRKVLGDDGNGNKYIETVAKKGYRFVAEVNELGEFHAPADSRNGNGHSSRSAKNSSSVAAGFAEPPPAEKPARIPRIVFFTAGFACAILLLFLALVEIEVQPIASLPKEKSKAIAVLPFKPINTANRDELYEIGVADLLIHRLSRMKGFVIRPVNATRKYNEIESDPLAAGREQQVDYVLASNYQLIDGKIRVTAQLINVAGGQTEETYKIEKTTGDIFAVQDAIAGELGDNLMKRFAVDSTDAPAVRRGTLNEEAYRLYLQGMYLCDKRNLSDAREAVRILEQAVKLDPNYALAWAGKAYAHRVVGNHGRNINTHEQYRKSIEAIDKALALDENLAEAHSVLCENKMYYEYDFTGAERECRRAIELDPNSSLAHQVYSRYLNSRGRSDEALQEIKTAIDLEPTSYHNQRNLGISLYFARRYDEAQTQLKRVIAMDKDIPSAYMWLNFALEMQGNEAEVFEWFIKSPGIRDETAALQVYQTAFRSSGWQNVLRERLKRFETGNESYFHAAAYGARIGNKDKAFEYLEKSFERRELWIANLHVDPRLDPLREDPRFDDFVRRIGSTNYAIVAE